MNIKIEALLKHHNPKINSGNGIQLEVEFGNSVVTGHLTEFQREFN